MSLKKSKRLKIDFLKANRKRTKPKKNSWKHWTDSQQPRATKRRAALRGREPKAAPGPSSGDPGFQPLSHQSAGWQLFLSRHTTLVTKACCKPCNKAVGVFLAARHRPHAAQHGRAPAGRSPGQRGSERSRDSSGRGWGRRQRGWQLSFASHSTSATLHLPPLPSHQPSTGFNKRFNPFPWAWVNAQRAQDLTHPAALGYKIIYNVPLTASKSITTASSTKSCLLLGDPSASQSILLPRFVGLSWANPSQKAPGGNCALPVSGSTAPAKYSPAKFCPWDGKPTGSYQAGKLLFFAYQEASYLKKKISAQKKKKNPDQILKLFV